MTSSLQDHLSQDHLSAHQVKVKSDVSFRALVTDIEKRGVDSFSQRELPCIAWALSRPALHPRLYFGAASPTVCPGSLGTVDLVPGLYHDIAVKAADIVHTLAPVGLANVVTPSWPTDH